MNTRLITSLEKLRGSYWFLPALMVILAIGLSLVTVTIDREYLDTWPEALDWIDIGDPDGARTFLSTIAGSMITVAGVVFSITIAALVQASGQFGPRLLGNFMRDQGNQIVLGTFIATFMYCLLVLRSVTDTEREVFVPHLALLVGLFLIVASAGVLVYFFHHISASLQAETVIASVGRELEMAVARLFPQEMNVSAFERPGTQGYDVLAELDQDEAGMVPAIRSGYLQAIDMEGLVALAEEHDLVLRLAHRPGDFVAKESDLVAVWPEDRLDDELESRIERAFVLGNQRLRLHDVEFMVNQLVEIAVRALSPGINDPFTAMGCVDQLSAGLTQLVKRSVPAGYHLDSSDQLRVVTDALTFTGIIDAAFDQIRQHARGDVAVTIRLLEAIAAIAPHTRTSEQRVTLARQAEMISRASQEAIPEEWDRDDIEKRYRQAMRAIDEA